MSRSRRTVLAAAAAAVAALIATVGASGRSAVAPSCGMVATTDVTFVADLSCSGDGIVVGADGITVDLDGHTLGGDGTGDGVSLAGHDGVTVEDGTVETFSVGIFSDTAADDLVVSGVVARDETNRGAWIVGTHIRVTRSVFIRNGNTGLEVRAPSSDVRIASTTSAHNAAHGIVAAVDGLLVSKTTAARNGSSNQDGLVLSGTGLAVKDVLAVGNAGDGVTISGPTSAAVVARVTAYGNGGNGIDVNDADGFLITRSTATGNGANGIDVLADSDGGAIAKSRAIGNGAAGIAGSADSNLTRVTGSTATGNATSGIAIGTALIGKSTALGNGSTGISGGPLSVNLGKNRARGNAQAQCSGSITCPEAHVPGPGGDAGIGCGHVASASIVLGADLSNCSGTGIAVAADGITIDLNGHTVDGNASAGHAGIDLQGHTDVTIENGVVVEFDTGVAADGADGLELRDVESRENLGDGLAATAERVVVDRSLLVANGDDGLQLYVATGGSVVSSTIAVGNSGAGLEVIGPIEIANDTISANGVWGIFGSGVGTVVSGSTISANTGPGIRLGGGAPVAGSTVTKNLVAGNLPRNIQLQNSVVDAALGGNTVSANTVIGGGRAMVFDGTAPGLTVAKNTVFGTEGIEIGADTGQAVLQNRVVGAAFDGIRVDGPSTVLARNTADLNDDLGLRADNGAVDGGGNVARWNGDADECTPSSLCD